LLAFSGPAVVYTKQSIIMTLGEVANLVVSGIVTAVGLWIRLEVSRFRAECLTWRMEDERRMRDWVEAQFRQRSRIDL
jgi:hypothetical protein